MKVPMNLRENRSFGIRLLKNMCGINDNIVKNIDTIIEKKIIIQNPSLFFENISAFINLIFVNYFFILKNFIYNFTLKNESY